MIPELGYLSIDGAALQRGATQPQNHHPGIVLGQTVTPLVSHHTGAPPSHPAPLTITQPQSLQERSCGQTRKLFSSERTQRVGRLKLGGMGTVVRTTECRIRNLRPTNPLLGALRARLGGDFSVVGRQDGASVKAIMNINEFNDKAALEQFCNFVEVMRSCYNVDDQAIAFLLLKGCPWKAEPFQTISFLADGIGKDEIFDLINNGHHDLAGVLLTTAARDGRNPPALKSVYEVLFNKFMQHGLDPRSFGISPTCTCNDFTNLRALFCIDLCAGLKLDPVQAGRIVLSHMGETRRPLPYQHAVMECLRAMINTPEEAYRALMIFAGARAHELPIVRYWIGPLVTLCDKLVDDGFAEVWESLIVLQKTKLDRGPDRAAIESTKLLPIGDPSRPNLDAELIERLKAVVNAGARAEKALALAVAAFGLLAWDARMNPSEQKISDLNELGQELVIVVSTSPYPGVSSRAEELEKFISRIAF